MYLKLDRISPVPFDSALKVKFAIKMKSLVKICVSDFFGKEISTLVYGNHEPGEYEAEFSGYNLPSGSYSFTMETEYSVETKRAVIINDRLNCPVKYS